MPETTSPLPGAYTPRPAAHWRDFLATLGLFAGVLLFSSGLIFFFAYNWDSLSRFTRLGIAASALVTSVGLTLCARPGGWAWRAGALLVCMCMGALLALIGQIYQTGADIWQLFATWAALMLPVVLGTRTQELWLLWLAVAGLALGRWLGLGLEWGIGWGLMRHAHAHAVVGLFYAAMLAVLHVGKRWLIRPDLGWLEVVLWCAALSLLCSAAMQHTVATQLVFVVLAALGWWVALRRLQALLLAWVYGCLLLWGLSHVERITHEWMIMALLVLVASGAGLSHALSIWRQARQIRGQSAALGEAISDVHLQSLAWDGRIAPAGGGVGASESTTPWWIDAAMACAAWLVALLAVGGLSRFMMDLPIGLLSLAVIALGFYCMRSLAGLFMHQLGFALSIAGQCWLLGTMWQAFSFKWELSWLIMAALTALCSLPRSLQAHRGVCVAASMVCMLLGVVPDLQSLELHIWLFVPLLFALAFAGWLHADQMDRRGWLYAATQACTWLALGLAMLVPYGFSTAGQHDLYAYAQSLSVGLWVACLLALLYHRSQRWQWWMVVAVPLTVLAWFMPFFALTLALMLVLFEQRQRALVDVALLACVALLGVYYYEMNISLLHKSLSLMGAGVLTALIAWLTHPPQTRLWLP